MDGLKFGVKLKTAISFICKDNTVRTIQKEGRNIENTAVLVTETFTIQNTLCHAIQNKYTKVITDSDSLVAIQAITGKSVPSKNICSLVEDNNMLDRKMIINYVY